MRPETPKQLRARLIASGFPENYIDRSPAEYRVDDNSRDSLEKTRAFVNDPNGTKGLYICGPTWLAALIGRKIAERGKWVAFGAFNQITNNLQRAIKSNSEYERLWARYIRKAEFMVIDDIGKEKPSEWKLQTLFDIIDAREQNKLFTVFTSNYSLEELCGRISPADGDNITAGAVRSRLSAKNSPENTYRLFWAARTYVKRETRLKHFVPLMLSGGSRRGK